MLYAKCKSKVDPWNSENNNSELVIGQRYPVEYVSMGQSYSRVTIKINDERKSYNTSFFDFFLDKYPHDVFRDPEYNEYLDPKYDEYDENLDIEAYKKYLVERGKELSYLLRHDKSYKFDKHGWRTIEDLKTNHFYTDEELDDIVETNNKQRYEFNKDKTAIRARQGHSVNADVELKQTTPPDILYHGTIKDVYENHIKKEGLKPQNRLYVHLSKDVETAENVGKRHGKNVVILKINAKQMVKDGYKFYLSNNGVWLTEEVKHRYITI